MYMNFNPMLQWHLVQHVATYALITMIISKLIKKKHNRGGELTIDGTLNMSVEMFKLKII